MCTSSAWMAWRRRSSSSKTALLSRIRATRSVRRWLSSRETDWALSSRPASLASLAAIVRESRDRPVKLAWISVSAESRVSARTPKACSSRLRSIRSVVVVRSPSTPTMSYAAWVRSSGIVPSGSSWPAPSGWISRYFSPSRLRTSTEARDCGPNSTPGSTSKVATTRSRWISSPETRPTRWPAICTIWPFRSPLASSNSAW